MACLFWDNGLAKNEDKSGVGEFCPKEKEYVWDVGSL